MLWGKFQFVLFALSPLPTTTSSCPAHAGRAREAEQAQNLLGTPDLAHSLGTGEKSKEQEDLPKI